MILCDMDGVLATGPAGDTAWGEPIYRTFREIPPELDRIRAAGISLHVVTAKVEAEAIQVLEAIGLDAHVASVVGADQLFWPSVLAAIKNRRLPRSLSKSVYRVTLAAGRAGRVVMLEDRQQHLHDMLAAGVIDFGILVPPITITEGYIRESFDLDLAFRMARELASGKLQPAELVSLDVSVYGWQSGVPESFDLAGLEAFPRGERYLLHLPKVTFAEAPSSGPAVDCLDTGRVLVPARANVVSTVRAGRRFVRRIVRRFRGSAAGETSL